MLLNYLKLIRKGVKCWRFGKDVSTPSMALFLLSGYSYVELLILCGGNIMVLRDMILLTIMLVKATYNCHALSSLIDACYVVAFTFS
jgi:hypothetical protein